MSEQDELKIYCRFWLNMQSAYKGVVWWTSWKVLFSFILFSGCFFGEVTYTLLSHEEQTTVWSSGNIKQQDKALGEMMK